MEGCGHLFDISICINYSLNWTLLSLVAIRVHKEIELTIIKSFIIGLSLSLIFMSYTHISPYLVLALALLTTLALSLSQQPHPLLQTTIVTAYLPHSHSTTQVDIHLGSYLPGYKVIHGLKNMQWLSKSLGDSGW